MRFAIPRDTLCDIHYHSYTTALKRSNPFRARRIAQCCSFVKLGGVIGQQSCLPPEENWRCDPVCDCGHTGWEYSRFYRLRRPELQRRIHEFCPSHMVVKDSRWPLPQWMQREKNRYIRERERARS